MRIAKIIGNVTLSRCDPGLVGCRLLIGVPYSLAALKNNTEPDGEDVVMYDDLGAGTGQQIAFSESSQAAAPFFPNRKPIDAYCACILDSVTIERDAPQRHREHRENK